jgi:hypothetical protein
MKEKIKIWLVRSWFKVVLLIILIVAIVSAFYWYEIRPSKIYSKCHKEAGDGAIQLLKTKVELGSSQYSKASDKDLYLKEDYDYYYKNCLRKYGIYE